MSEDRITLRFDSFRGFLEECSDRISEEGIFLATQEIKPVGSTLEFHLDIDDRFPLLRGTGEVVWVVEPDGDGDVPGMAVRYGSTDEATATLARKIAERQREKGGSASELKRSDEPPAVERAPSLVTQAVDALIEDAPEPEPHAEAVTEPEAAPAPPIELAGALEELEAVDLELESPQKRSRAGVWAALAVVAALAGAAYWQRDLLREKLGGGSETGLAAPVAEPEPASPEEPSIQTPDEVAIQTPVEPDLVSETPAPADVPIPAPSGPLTRIEEVRWQASVGFTVLELVADGAFAVDGFTVERLDDPPRLLLKIAGVTAPLPSPTLAVGSEEVVGVRTGLHGSPPSSSLHVVVDLADPTAQVTSSEVRGAVLQLQVTSSAISP